MKYIFFDVAGTLLYKPKLYITIKNILRTFGINISESTIVKKHKILSEVITSPEKTSKNFYQYFNSELLYSLGVVPKKKIVDKIFKNCSRLPWKKFEDTEILKDYKDTIGVISNWDETLREKLKSIFDFDFKNLVISSELGVLKPDLRIYKKAILKAKVPASKILHIGDSIKLDIEPALKIGMQAVLIDRYNVYPNFNGLKIKTLYELKDIIKK